MPHGLDSATVTGEPKRRKNRKIGYPPEVWEQAFTLYRMGFTYTAISKRLPMSITSISKQVRRRGLSRDLTHLREEWRERAIAAAKSQQEANEGHSVADLETIDREMPSEGEIRDILGAIRGEKGGGLQQNAVSDPVAGENPPEQVSGGAREFFETVAKEAAILQDHRQQSAKAVEIVDKALDKLGAFMVHGEVENIVTVKTKAGEFYSLPFLGKNESPADAIVKLATAMQKLHSVQRAAAGMKPAGEQKQGPQAVGMSVSVHLPGKTISIEAPKQQAEPERVIDGECETIGETVAHLGAAE